MVRSELAGGHVGNTKSKLQRLYKNKSALDEEKLENEAKTLAAEVSSTYKKNILDLAKDGINYGIENWGVPRKKLAKAEEQYTKEFYLIAHGIIHGHPEREMNDPTALFTASASAASASSDSPLVRQKSVELLYYSKYQDKKHKEGFYKIAASMNNPNKKDSKGRTHLHYAVMKEEVATVEALLVAGFDADLKDNSGTSPRDLAARSEVEGIRAAFSNIKTVEGSPPTSTASGYSSSFWSTTTTTTSTSTSTKSADADSDNITDSTKIDTASHIKRKHDEITKSDEASLSETGIKTLSDDEAETPPPKRQRPGIS